MTGPAARRRHAFVAGAAAVVVGIAARGFWTWDAARYVPDSYSYLLLAKSIAAGDGYTTGGSQHPALTRAPLYPVLLAAASRLAPSVDTAATVMNLFLGGLAAIPLALLARRLGGRGAGYAGLALAAVSCLVGGSEFDLPESLYFVLLLATVAATWAASRAPSPRRAALAGSFAGLAALTRPEGIVWLAFAPAWILVASSRRIARPSGRIAGAAGIATCMAVVVYAPYVAWVSRSLGRFEPAPGVTFLRDMRTVSDVYGLRASPTPPSDWPERARFVMDSSHRELLLDAWFLERRLIPPDPRFADSQGATERPGQRALSVGALRRRRNILLGNVVRIPAALWREHLLPLAPVLLGLLGVGGLAIRRRLRVLAYLALVVAATIAPFASHVEERFLYAPFAVGLAVAALGWGEVDRFLRHRPAARAGAHVLLFAATALAVARHPFAGRQGIGELSAQRSLGAELARALPPGPMLAVRPAVAYWADRPYRPIPLGRPEDVLTYARGQGAVALVLEMREDKRRRPELAPLLEDPLPPGFERLVDRHESNGEALRVLRILPQTAVP